MTLSAFYWLPVEQNVRNFNKHAVVDPIRFADRGISKADLIEQRASLYQVAARQLHWQYL